MGEAIESKGFNVSLADYAKYNAATFDPIDNNRIGNYGIDSIRNTTANILQNYHDEQIAASRVDVIAHSMGGLMARGLTQQSDYKNESNYMEGYINKLITIGTPHFGAQLSGILFDHQDEPYCHEVDNNTLFIIPVKHCGQNQDPKSLKDIYNEIHFPIDRGGIEALKPGSEAFDNLNKTEVASYAIIGDWKPNAKNSHQYLEDFYRNITGNSNFKLEGIEGFGEDNDLQVNITSQSGGLVNYLTCKLV